MAAPTLSPPRRPPLITVTLLGFTAGIPLSLTTGTLQAWLEHAQVNLGSIGLFALAGLPYSLKILWSPLLDHYPLPAGGRRRGWIALSMLGLLAVLVLLGFTDPRSGLLWVGLLAFLSAFAGASGDIALDAYRTEVLPSRWQGLGTSLHITGYRIGMVLAGSAALWLSARISWRWVFLVLAASLIPGIVIALRGPEPPAPAPAPTLGGAVVQPFREFLARGAARPMLAAILLYKVGDNLATLLWNPFLMEHGFPASEIGLAYGYAGLPALLAGGVAGGWGVHRFGLPGSLRALAWLQVGAILGALALVPPGGGRLLLFAYTAFQSFIFAMAGVAYLALIAALTHPAHAATQFALLTSLSALSRVLFPSLAGFLVQALGWPVFLVVSALLCLPVLGSLRSMETWDWPRRDAG